MKILVTGNAEAGKSTLAARLGKRLDLSVISLDSIVWKSGWWMPEEDRYVESRHSYERADLIVDGTVPYE